MHGGAMISDELRSFIGRGEPMVLEVERGAIRRYADAIGDSNPLYWDRDYARGTKYGKITAPPGFFGWPVKWTNAMPFATMLRMELNKALHESGYTRGLDGGIEYEFFVPIRDGDTLFAFFEIVDIVEKSAKMALYSTKTSYFNQNGAQVAVALQTIIWLK